MSKHKRNGNGIDRERAERAIAELLEAMGYDSESELLKQTPERVVKAFEELTTARDFNISYFANESGHGEPLLIRDIEFVSMCEHHLLPFRGLAHVGYVPNEQLIGLSALPFVVEKFAHTLQLQEALTDEIAEYVAETTGALGVAVMIEADHMCMQARGVRAANAKTITHAFRGELRDDQVFRTWFYSTAGAIS